MNYLLFFLTCLVFVLATLSCSPVESGQFYSPYSITDLLENRSRLVCDVPKIYRLDIPSLESLKPSRRSIRSVALTPSNKTLRAGRRNKKIITHRDLTNNGLNLTTVRFSFARPNNISRSLRQRVRGGLAKAKEAMVKMLAAKLSNQTSNKLNNTSSSRAVSLLNDNHQRNKPGGSLISVPVKPLKPASDAPQVLLDNHKTTSLVTNKKLRPITLITTLKVRNPPAIPLVDYHPYTIKDAENVRSRPLVVVDSLPGETPRPTKLIHRNLVVFDKKDEKKPVSLPNTIVIPIVLTTNVEPQTTTESTPKQNPQGGYGSHTMVASDSYNIPQHVQFDGQSGYGNYGTQKPINSINVHHHLVHSDQGNYGSGSYGSNNGGYGFFSLTSGSSSNDYNRPYPPTRPTSRPESSGYGYFGNYGGTSRPDYDPYPRPPGNQENYPRPPGTQRPSYRPPGVQSDADRPHGDDISPPGFRPTTQGNQHEFSTPLPNFVTSVFPIPSGQTTVRPVTSIISTQFYTTTTPAPPAPSTFIEVTAPTTTARPGTVTLIETPAFDDPPPPTTVRPTRRPTRRPTPPKRKPTRPFSRPTRPPVRPLRPTRPPSRPSRPTGPQADDPQTTTEEVDYLSDLGPGLEIVTLPPTQSGTSNVFVPVTGSGGGGVPVMTINDLGISGIASMSSMVRSILGALLIFLPSALVAAGIISSRTFNEPYLEFWFPPGRLPPQGLRRSGNSFLSTLPSVGCDTDCLVRLVALMTDTEPAFIRKMKDSPQMESLVDSLKELWTSLTRS